MSIKEAYTNSLEQLLQVQQTLFPLNPRTATGPLPQGSGPVCFVALARPGERAKKEPRPKTGSKPMPGRGVNVYLLVSADLLGDTGLEAGIVAACRQLDLQGLDGNATIATRADHATGSRQDLKELEV